MSQHYLKNLFEPESIAVFGASERAGSVGAVVTENLLAAGFKGQIYLINPKHASLQGQRCYPDLDDISGAIDLVVITTPAHTVPGIIESCGQRGVKAAVILSAGFREAGPEGIKLEQSLIENARRYGMRFVGPNCLGIMRPGAGLNATFNKGFAKAGKMALVSQSGALCTAILDWASNQDIGFSTVVSMGISADINFGEVLDYLVADPQTGSILLYIEGIEDARAFMSGIRSAARVKPVIAVKVGRHQAGSKAAMSHTGALVGADDVFDAALRRAGVVRGMHVGDLFAAATVLSGGMRVHGDRLAIITNGGGPAAMACDRASDLDIPLAELSATTIEKLNKYLPAMWSHNNPVDILGDAGPERYQQAVETCLADANVDGALVILTPQAMTEPTAVADSIVSLAAHTHKPMITCWMGDQQVGEARRKFAQANIPTFRLPETAIQGYAYLTNFHRNQKLLLQMPGPLDGHDKPDIDGARMIIENVLAEKRSVLSEMEAKAVLAAFHIPVTRGMLARSASEALIHAEAIGFPVAMKIYSHQITHKSDVGGVRLGIGNASAVQSAYREMIETARKNCPGAEIEGVLVQAMHSPRHGRELLLGIVRDSVFGPVISFGLGGTAVEVIRDQAMALPPLNSLLVKDLISRTRAAKLLNEFRRMPAVNFKALEQVLLRVSALACELPWIQELDINPLIADENGAVAVDARIVVAHVPTAQRHYSHMAIHPYPSYRVSQTQLPGGVDMTIRPIRPEDAEIEQAFVRNLSQRAKYFRFFQHIDELSPEMLARFTQIDYDREMAFIAVIHENGREKQIGVCRYVANADGKGCEFAVVIADDWQHHGVAHKLMEKLIECARDHDMEYIEGRVLKENMEMQALIKSLGFSSKTLADEPSALQVIKQLQ